MAHLAKFVVIVLLLFLGQANGDLNMRQQGWRMGIGSRPPRCTNKCLTCRPCVATLVVSPHHKRPTAAGFAVQAHDQGDDGYYLLAWKCACGNKLFQP